MAGDTARAVRKANRSWRYISADRPGTACGPLAPPRLDSRAGSRLPIVTLPGGTRTPYSTTGHVMIPARLTAFALLSLVVAGCGKEGPPPPPPAAPVTVARPVPYQVQSYYAYNGHLEAVETVEVKARVKGLLKEIQFVEGDEVKAGSKLYDIDPREYRTAVARSQAELSKSEADILNREAQVRLAELESRRLDRLGGSVAQSEVDKAKAALDVSKAELAVSRAEKEAAAAALQTANIQLGYTDIKAPIAGRISRTLVTKGNLVGQSEPTLLTTIVGVDPLYVYFDAPESDLVEALRRKTPASGASATATQVAVEVGVATEQGFPHVGVIDFRENRVDAGTGTVRIRGSLPNPPSEASGKRLLYPGLYAQVRVPDGPPVARPVIPEDALLTDQTGQYVYVIGPGDVAEKRAVIVGDRVFRAPPVGEVAAPGWGLVNPNPKPAAEGKEPPPVRIPVQAAVAINKGLAVEDRVVVGGLQRVRLGAALAPELWELRAPPAPAKPAS